MVSQGTGAEGTSTMPSKSQTLPARMEGEKKEEHKKTVCQLYSVYISLFYNNKKIITIYEREIPNKV
jgi:hypothetical protein